MNSGFESMNKVNRKEHRAENSAAVLLPVCFRKNNNK